MRLPAVVAIAVLPFALSGAAPPNAPTDAPSRGDPLLTRRCVPDLRLVRSRDGSFMGDQPASFDLHLAVFRTENGCPVPAILRRDVGGRGRTEERPGTSRRGLARPL